MSELSWTNRRPSKKGWYFYQSTRSKSVEIAYVSGRKKIYATVFEADAGSGESSCVLVNVLDGQWAGPILPPKHLSR